MDPAKEQRMCIKFCANLGKSATEALAMTGQAIGEESMRCTQVFEWQTQFRAKPSQSLSKLKSMLIIFFVIKRIVHREFILVGHTVNSTHYCDVLRRLGENM
jgi:hypothetical protein